MRGFFNGLVLGVILGAVGYWFLQKKAAEHPEAQQRYEESAAHLKTNAVEVAHNVSDALSAKLDTLDLRADQISDELKKKGEIVRRKAQDLDDQMVNATSDARAVTEIKAKYVADSTLSAWDISVSCAQGHVTLTGMVSSPEDIGRAVAIALDADGVRDVTSTLTVKPKS
ncbi:MAG TPA: BON domain-containing protein [Verrucomicrobiae bacterium]|nr:BON domain-containing protein [Verrucomicrobiae bacterium]